jgi:hypothetical protein
MATMVRLAGGPKALTPPNCRSSAVPAIKNTADIGLRWLSSLDGFDRVFALLAQARFGARLKSFFSLRPFVAKL